jgi:hypothetical protein
MKGLEKIRIKVEAERQSFLISVPTSDLISQLTQGLCCGLATQNILTNKGKDLTRNNRVMVAAVLARV